MNRIRKTRREWFGGIVYSEHPGFTAFVDERRADHLGIAPRVDLPPGLLSAPLDVHLSITNRCNLRCEGCYAPCGGARADDMPMELAERVLDRLAAMDVFTVALGGGEPLLHPEWFDIARSARTHAIVPNLTTNGLCIDRSTAAQCRVFGSVHLSCHRPEELDRLSDAAGHLQAAGVEPGLNVLVSSRTCEQLPDVLRWCRRTRISRALFLKFKLTEHNRAFAHLMLSPEQERGLLPAIRRWSRKCGVLPMLDCSLFPALAAHRPKKRDLEFFDVNGCQGGIAYLAVTADGRIKPCSFSPQTLGGVEDLNRGWWTSCTELRRFREGPRAGRCAACEYADPCNGGCRVCDVQGCGARRSDGL